MMNHAREMDFTGKSMAGFVYISPQGFAEDAELAEWLSYCTDFVESLASK